MLSTMNPAFREGDEVILGRGTYEGTSGVFLRLRPDVHWADILEADGHIRSHPVAWLDHAKSPVRGCGQPHTTELE